MLTLTEQFDTVINGPTTVAKFKSFSSDNTQTLAVKLASPGLTVGDFVCMEKCTLQEPH